jgi:hypothetical protein
MKVPNCISYRCGNRTLDAIAAFFIVLAVVYGLVRFEVITRAGIETIGIYAALLLLLAIILTLFIFALCGFDIPTAYRAIKKMATDFFRS